MCSSTACVKEEGKWDPGEMKVTSVILRCKGARRHRGEERRPWERGNRLRKNGNLSETLGAMSCNTGLAGRCEDGQPTPEGQGRGHRVAGGAWSLVLEEAKLWERRSSQVACASPGQGAGHLGPWGEERSVLRSQKPRV